ARMRAECSAEDLAGSVGQAAAKDSDMAWLVDAIKPVKSAPAAAPEEVDGILDQLDLGDGGGDEPPPADKPPAKSPMGSLISAAASQGAAVPPGEMTALRRAVVEIDRRVSAWLAAIIHAPQVQALETAWTSLRFLVSRMEFRKGVRLSILNARRDEITDRFVAKVIDPVFDEGAAAPDLVSVGAQFTNSASDLETLDELAQHAASLPAMALAGVGSGFFGVKHSWQITTLPSMVNMFDQWQFAKWKSLRNQPYARNLGVVFGRMLLRAPYTKEGGTEQDYGFVEKCIADKDFIWASGPIAAACTVANSVVKTGWPAAMAGHVHGRVENMPVCEAGKKGDKQFGPTDTKLPQPKIEEMGFAGLNAVAGLQDGHDALFWNGLTAARPEKLDPNSLLEVSLPYHLFAGRLSALLFALKPHLTGMDAEKLCATVIGHVRTWLKLGDGNGDQVSAQVRPAEDDPAALQLALTVTPPNNLVPGGIPVVMGYKIARA
ncbi:MAG: type VI secretion system contractile sheath large subunit, partial [bacterium]|nr:type VI secretion system contractile sheath large subunit [bacterium]